ncbi:uncharacterized protein DNG_10333 [Cephalotrichum gorgonifer]|uniref:Uncharacterized protein n=1 Tax=Cephalotrichum gorgonifer TaxID=2041049 RepID=A0AAE8N8T3_9PEZI|nr:uncharacterized protein DNG_10333 [Cephalotrichum gorgonifer]
MIRGQRERGESISLPLSRPDTQSTYTPSYYNWPPQTDSTKTSSLGIYPPISRPVRHSVRGHRLRRFWSRTLALLLAPLTITGYFIFIWQYFLRDPGTIDYGTFDERWIFYSWFAVGVFGLSISRFGILGIEAAMLQDPFWQAKSAMVLFMHSGSTWAGAGGWIRCIVGTFRWKRSIAGRLWYLLSFITVALFIGLPISGLSLELADGYIHSSAAPMVIGHTWSDFNDRDELQAETRGSESWRTGSSVSLPGIGLAYTPSYLRRDQFSFLKTLPNSLPLDRGVPELFLAPQADAPINGEAWGLRLSYNCSIVESVSDLTILSRKSTLDWFKPSFITFPTLIDDPDLLGIEAKGSESKERMYVFNSSRLLDSRPTNVWAYGELGLSRGDPSAWDGTWRSNGSESNTWGWDGSFNAGVLEYVLWQVGFSNDFDQGFHSLTIGIEGKGNRSNVPVVDFNSSVDPSISGMDSPFKRGSDGTFGINESFFSPALPSNVREVAMINGEVRALADPIAVRCNHNSALGTAQVDAGTTSFSAFNPTPPPFFNETVMNSRTSPFGGTTEQILSSHYLDIFGSTNSPPPVSSANRIYYTSFVQPQMLLQSVQRAYAMDALQLMYDGLPTLSGAYVNGNLTSSRKGKVLQLGVMPPIIPVIWLSVWALVCLLMGLSYGFRRRWSASLDGYSLFRFGADFADEVGDLPSVEAFEECERLWDMPGFVGDSRAGESTGYISLVSREKVADRGKLYV